MTYIVWRGGQAVDQALSKEHQLLGFGALGWSCAISRDGRLAQDGPISVVADGVVYDCWTRVAANALLKAYSDGGAQALAHLDGRFSFVLIDARTPGILVGRDPLGRRTLLYAERDLGFWASCPELAARQLATRKVRPSRVAASLALSSTWSGETFFEGLAEVPAGCMCRAQDGGLHELARWRPDMSLGSSVKERASQVHQLSELLDRSTQRILSADESAGVMMSGGTDSTTVAAFAARQRDAVPLLSWRFRTGSRMDESYFVRATASHLKQPLNWVPAESIEILPLQTWLATPETNIYRRLKDDLYRTAGSLGMRIVLNGLWGDELFRVPGDRRGPRQLARRLLRGMRRPHPWLSAAGKALLEPSNEGRFGAFPRPRQARLVLGRAAAYGSSWERAYLARFGCEPVSPFRDCDLVSFALSRPHIHLRGDLPKQVLREVARPWVPHVVGSRRLRTSLSPVFEDALRRDLGATMAQVVGSAPEWPTPLIRAGTLEGWKNGAFRTDAERLVYWLLYCHIQWMRAYDIQASGL